MKTSFEKLHKNAKENIILSKGKRKELYDKNTRQWQLLCGEMVLVRTNPTGALKKLQALWREPYEVVELPSKQIIIIKNGKKFE